MNFNFGKNNLFKQNFLKSKENKELDDKLDNIYENIQNIVFNESKINKLKSNNINMNIEPNDLSIQKEENIYKINKDFNDEEFIKLLIKIIYSYQKIKKLNLKKIIKLTIFTTTKIMKKIT